MFDLTPIQKSIEALVDFGKYLASIATGFETAILRAFAVSDQITQRRQRTRQVEILVNFYDMMPIRMAIIQSILDYCKRARYYRDDDLRRADWLGIQKDVIHLQVDIAWLYRRLAGADIPPDLTMAAQKLMFATETIHKFFLENDPVSDAETIDTLGDFAVTLQIILMRLQVIVTAVHAHIMEENSQPPYRKPEA